MRYTTITSASTLYKSIMKNDSIYRGHVVYENGLSELRDDTGRLYTSEYPLCRLSSLDRVDAVRGAADTLTLIAGSLEPSDIDEAGSNAKFLDKNLKWE